MYAVTHNAMYKDIWAKCLYVDVSNKTQTIIIIAVICDTNCTYNRHIKMVVHIHHNLGFVEGDRKEKHRSIRMRTAMILDDQHHCDPKSARG